MRVCGECAWYAKEDEEWGDCNVPVPQSMYDMDKRSIHPSDNATDCPCFKARVCQRCGGMGKDDSVADRLSSDPIKPKGTPCPACHDEVCDLCKGKGGMWDDPRCDDRIWMPCPACRKEGG